MSLKTIYNELVKAQSLKSKYEGQCDKILFLVLKYFDFDIDSEYRTKEEFFHVEYQPSDGFVLGDDDSNVYALTILLNHIQYNGSIKSLDELRSNFSI